MTSTPSSEKTELINLISRLQKLDLKVLDSDHSVKDEALGISRKLVAALEGPVNRATDLMFRPYISIAARTAVDLDLFRHIISAHDSITSHQLATLTSGDESLISRVLRLLASVDIVHERGAQEWAANDTTRAMATPEVAAGHRFVYDILVCSAIKAPKFLKEAKYKAPEDPTDGFVQYANQTKHNIFEFLQSMPDRFQDFNMFMGNTMGAREYWHEWYDVEHRVLDGFQISHSKALLVDIGGGKGHDLVAFDGKFGSRIEHLDLVLQDVPEVLDSIPDSELRPNIVKMPQDFFQDQAVKGARGYFLHHILHDWSDKYCHQILKGIRTAMIPGYSKLLIHDLILPDVGAVEIQARFDLVMMTFNGGMERSKSQWTKLLEEAGFCNIKLWEHFDHDGIIEAEVP